MDKNREDKVGVLLLRGVSLSVVRQGYVWILEAKEREILIIDFERRSSFDLVMGESLLNYAHGKDWKEKNK